MEDVNYSEPASKKRFSKRLIFFALFFLVVVVLLGGLFYFLNQGSKDETPKTISLEESQTVTEEPTASPTPEVDRSEIKVAVQNGSGVAGAAGEVADALKALGYQIVSTENADNFDYEDVTIEVKEDKEDILDVLESDLSKDFTVGSKSSSLSANLSYDVLVIVGK